ncbi:MAG: hypothetical protein J2P23_09145 [Microlunatus sp.]|nr:hypothetical protein [Microlunatus sp.]
MDVIGAAPGRSGTLSTKIALEMIGYGPCHHMSEVFARPELAGKWADVLSGQPADWDSLFAGYRSTVDWPSTNYWRELADHFPDAKVIFSARDPEQWYASMQQTILTRMAADNVDERGPLSASPEHRRLAEQLPGMRAAFFGVDGIPTLEQGIAAYQRNLDDVRRAVDPDRLLIFQLDAGWQPLCEFLDVPVPDAEFPRVNKAADFEQNARKHAGVDNDQR